MKICSWVLRTALRRMPAASALLAWRAHGEPLPQPAFTEAGFSICIQCWSFRHFTLFEALEMAAAAGAGAVELYPGQRLGGGHGDATLEATMPVDQLAAVIDQLKKHHLAAVNFGVVEIPNHEAEARKVFEFAKALGLYGLTTESLGAIDLLEKLSVDYALNVCFHNHPRPTALWHPERLWQALEGRHPNLGMCADLGHWASSGLNPLEMTRRYAPRIHAFHLKDRASLTEPSRDQPFGTGLIDLAEILRLAVRHGFRGNATIEYEFNWQSNLAEIAQCVGFLRACAAQQQKALLNC
jgi:sugar phosphate isomerase/epimerase